MGTASMMAQASLAPLATTRCHTEREDPMLSPKTKNTSIAKTSRIARATPHPRAKMKRPSWDSVRSHAS